MGCLGGAVVRRTVLSADGAAAPGGRCRRAHAARGTSSEATQFRAKLENTTPEQQSRHSPSCTQPAVAPLRPELSQGPPRPAARRARGAWRFGEASPRCTSCRLQGEQGHPGARQKGRPNLAGAGIAMAVSAGQPVLRRPAAVPRPRRRSPACKLLLGALRCRLASATAQSRMASSL